MNNTPRLEVYEDKAKPPGKQWWWRIWISSNIIAASSEGYKNRVDCLDNIKNVEQRIKYLRENNLIK